MLSVLTQSKRSVWLQCERVGGRGWEANEGSLERCSTPWGRLARGHCHFAAVTQTAHFPRHAAGASSGETAAVGQLTGTSPDSEVHPHISQPVLVLGSLASCKAQPPAGACVSGQHQLLASWHQGQGWGPTTVPIRDPTRIQAAQTHVEWGEEGDIVGREGLLGITGGL